MQEAIMRLSLHLPIIVALRNHRIIKVCILFNIFLSSCKAHIKKYWYVVWLQKRGKNLTCEKHPASSFLEEAFYIIWVLYIFIKPAKDFHSIACCVTHFNVQNLIDITHVAENIYYKTLALKNV